MRDLDFGRVDDEVNDWGGGVEIVDAKDVFWSCA